MLKCKVILRDFHNDSVLFLGWCHIITSVWWYVNVGKYIIPWVCREFPYLIRISVHNFLPRILQLRSAGSSCTDHCLSTNATGLSQGCWWRGRWLGWDWNDWRFCATHGKFDRDHCPPSPENPWLEDEISFWGPAYFQGLLLLVSGSVNYPLLGWIKLTNRLTN